MTDSFERFEKFSSVISAIHRYIQKIESEEMIKYGLKGAYAQYLAALLSHSDGITATKLCDICGKDKAAVSRIINEMEAQGLIKRNCGKDNGYRACLLLTENGKKAAEYVRRKAKSAVEKAGNNIFGNKERIAFYEALDNISNNLLEIAKVGIE